MSRRNLGTDLESRSGTGHCARSLTTSMFHAWCAWGRTFHFGIRLTSETTAAFGEPLEAILSLLDRWRRQVAWQVREAKQQFSRIVDAARESGPQVVTRHGREVAVLLSIEEYRRLRGADLSDPLTAGPRDDAFAQILNDIVDERTGDVPGDIP